MISNDPKLNLGQLNEYKLMFAIKLSMEKRIKKFWAAGFFDLPAINATVFRWANTHWNVGCTNRDSSTPDLYVRTLGLAVVLVVL